MSRRTTTLLATALCFALLAAPASAKWYGSKMQGAPNVQYGCESALILGPIGGVVLAPTNQRSCTYRHGGYLYSNRPTFIAPSTGRVTHIRVKAGPHPAKLRLTVLTGSSRVNPVARDQSGLPTAS